MSKKIERIEEQLIHEIKAGTTLIFIETQEEDETVRILKNVAEFFNKGLSGTDILQEDQNLLEDEGLAQMATESRFGSDSADRNSSTMIDKIKALANKGDTEDTDTIYLFKDIPALLRSEAGRTIDTNTIVNATRIFKTLNKTLRKDKSALVILGLTYDLPKELDNDFKVLYHSVPDIDLLEKIFYDYIADSPLLDAVEKTAKTTIDEILRSAKGLTADQFRRCIASTFIKHQEIGAKTIDDILRIKKEIIQKDGMLEYVEEEVGFENVGGLNNLKEWAKKRKKAFSKEAEQAGLTTPTGILVWGVPGSGKSLISKAISGIWKRPILRFDIGRIFGSYVGESEKNMRNALRRAESIAPCILWIDEIEKAFSSADRGSEVSNRVLGTFLTWMQEKAQSENVFIVATANDVTLLPPELLRKGRFNQLFFVGEPNEEALKEIIAIQLEKHKLDKNNYDIERLGMVAAKKKLTGSEIEQVIIDAQFNAYYDREDPPNDDEIIVEMKAIQKPIATYFLDRIQDDEEKKRKYADVDLMSIDA
jgi:ATP-dependent 26S proteasome regulatory subunit